MTVGVLDLQGGVAEHLKSLEQIPEVNPIPVKKKEKLNNLDGLILPGGESTTMGKLINIFNLKEPIIKLAKQGTPIWGTCAGMILLAQKIKDETNHLGLMNITVQRNGYGNQLDSFVVKKAIPEISDKKIPLVFIRAPYITEVGPKAKILLKLNNKIVAVEEDNLLVTSFHPELEDDLTMHHYFIEKIKNNSI
nr:pyridoxal 5'-phosphate synthase glutaminase subunit PdxT [Halobacteroides halobius]